MRALVCGAGGFIGHHLAQRLKREGYWVRGVDLKRPRLSDTPADDFVSGDLREQQFVRQIIDQHFDEVYQLAADMGGAGYILTGAHDADVIHLTQGASRTRRGCLARPATLAVRSITEDSDNG
jgi:GDP-D-mannose 3',5'-epimerase